MSDLTSFVRESNRIEGIRDVRQHEIMAHEAFLSLGQIRVGDLQGFVRAVAFADLRFMRGMDVRVGSAPAGGPKIREELELILFDLDRPRGLLGEVSPYALHQAYEHLHPFMDGNGRSGRALWAWHRLRIGRDPFALGFLHSWYYESLESSRTVGQEDQ